MRSTSTSGQSQPSLSRSHAQSTRSVALSKRVEAIFSICRGVICPKTLFAGIPCSRNRSARSSRRRGERLHRRRQLCGQGRGSCRSRQLTGRGMEDEHAFLNVSAVVLNLIKPHAA